MLTAIKYDETGKSRIDRTRPPVISTGGSIGSGMSTTLPKIEERRNLAEAWGYRTAEIGWK